MYNEKVVSRLSNLIYLSALKHSNITIMSKKNKYGDVVKFFAQINSKNVIQKIRYKATGCTHFIALCSYFCEIVEGKKISQAKQINEEDLMKFAELEESRHHVYPIILDTFKLLINKYEKGIKSGKIKPCDGEDLSKDITSDVKDNTQIIDEKKVAKDKDNKQSHDKKLSKKSNDMIEKKSTKSNSTKNTSKSKNKVDKKNTDANHVSKESKQVENLKHLRESLHLQSENTNNKAKTDADIRNLNMLISKMSTARNELVNSDNNATELDDVEIAINRNKRKKSIFSWLSKNK